MLRARIPEHAKCVISILMIEATATLFRFAALSHILPGVFSDEALNGNEGIHTFRSGDRKVFFPLHHRF